MTTTTTTTESAADIRRALLDDFQARARSLRADLAISVIESHPFRVAQKDGTAITRADEGWQFAFGGGQGHHFATREQAAMVAARWNKLNPEYPVAVMSRRELTQLQLDNVCELMVALEGF